MPSTQPSFARLCRTTAEAHLTHALDVVFAALDDWEADHERYLNEVVDRLVARGFSRPDAISLVRFELIDDLSEAVA